MIYLALVASALSAAAGQILLKFGAAGRSGVELVNLSVAAGFGLYGLGAVLWLFALAKLPLYVVYPFTLLTLAIVFVSSIVILGERPDPASLAGWALIAAGICIVAWSAVSRAA